MTKLRHPAVVDAATLTAIVCGGERSIAADDPKAVIRAALESWRDDFNARRADHICDLFASDLLYDFQGLPEQNYALLCNRLHRALTDPALSFHNELAIKEIIVSGDLAVARLTWTDTLTDKGGKPVTIEEPGLDVFGRQSDGGWKIIRYMATRLSVASTSFLGTQP
jgi:ketosteroid isomerase-like protein